MTRRSNRYAGSWRAEDEVVAGLHLGKKQPVLNDSLLSLLGSEKGSEVGQPLLATSDQIVGSEGIGEFLQGPRIRTLQESVSALLKADARSCLRRASQ
jgi:hypothetical protein